jgi:hypothetical protein
MWVGATAGRASADRSDMAGSRKTKVGQAAALALVGGGVKAAGRSRGDESLAEELVTVPAHGHPPIRHVRTRSLLDELDWRLDVIPGLTTVAEREFIDAIRKARSDLTVDALDYRVVLP